jgi:hypothetical protein
MLVTTFLQRNNEIMLLLPIEQFRLQNVCHAAVTKVCPVCQFRTWLEREEHRVLPVSCSFESLHLDYLGSRFLRSYLRYVCTLAGGGGIIAGGFALQQFLLSEGDCTWESHDIDIFVDTETKLKQLQQLYTCYMNYLGYGYHCGVWTHYHDVEEGGNTTDDSDTNDKRSRVQSVRKIRQELERLSIDSKDEPYQKLATLALTHLPPYFREPSYIVRKSILLRTKVSIAHYRGAALANYRASVPPSMKHINLILVERRDHSHTPIDAELICRNFDMAQCGWALTVEENLSFKMHGVGDAVALARMGRMRYNTTAFSLLDEPINRQLSRTYKYQQRQMTF